GSDTREAVWLTPKKSTAVIALGNSSNVPIRATAQFSDGEAEEIEIQEGATKFIRRPARHHDAESIKLTTDGPAGSLRVAGFILADDHGFTSSIRFHDTKKIVQPNLYATNLTLKNANPRIVLKNASDVDLSARPRFFTAAGEQDNPVELPAMTLQPHQIVNLDLRALTQAAASRPDLDSVSVQVLNSGAPGSLIGAAYSKEGSSQLTYDVPLRDSGKYRNGTGSYPWRIDEDYSTVVAVTNVGNQPARFQVEIRYPGGPYSIKARELAIGETATFDLRQMRDEQQPDRTGKTLPLTLDQGQFHWSLAPTRGEPRIVGRAEVVSRSGRVASSYSCPVCCPDSGPYGGFDPSAYGLNVDGFVYTNAHGDYYDCYFNYYQGSLSFYQMWTYDTSIATVNGGELNGIAVGDTEVAGLYNYWYWSNDGMDCYVQYDTGGDNAPVDVGSSPDHVRVISDVQGTPASCPSTGLNVRLVTLQIVDINNHDVTGFVSVSESLSNISTNTCGNGQPSGSTCFPADQGGQFTDQMVVSQNVCNSGINRNSGCGYTLISNWSWCSVFSGVNRSIWTYSGETRSNLIKVDGSSTSIPIGTYLYGSGGPPTP
ncbi:MAG: hypothetical protein AABM67_21890, partial [Acidobacteriota bacterium]